MNAAREYPYFDHVRMFPPPFKRHSEPAKFERAQLKVLEFFTWCVPHAAMVDAKGPMLTTMVAGAAREAFDLKVERTADETRVTGLGGHTLVSFTGQPRTDFEAMQTELQLAHVAAGFECTRDDLVILAAVQAAAALVKPKA